MKKLLKNQNNNALTGTIEAYACACSCPICDCSECGKTCCSTNWTESASGMWSVQSGVNNGSSSAYNKSNSSGSK
jgi:hypothetical protein